MHRAVGFLPVELESELPPLPKVQPAGFLFLPIDWKSSVLVHPLRIAKC